MSTGVWIETFVRKGAKVIALPLGARLPLQNGDVMILCYHRVGIGAREIDIPRRRFIGQLESLAAKGTVRSLDAALSGSAGGVVVTFDDGFRDFHEVALPELVRLRVPALLYLATGFVGVGDPQATIGRDQALSWAMLEDAVSTGLVTIGSHTHGHVDLSFASEREAEDEMHRSKALVEDRLGRPCTDFAFPWGKASPAAERVARRCFKTVALDAWRTNRVGRIDPHRLGRTPVLRSDSEYFFRAKVRGQLDGERVIYRTLRRGPWRSR
jgi:peptidoglycan/xylan/chitin deacetylase (PgdA/CDA1 family)